jgi:Sec-independent protein translocase protein TatA
MGRSLGKGMREFKSSITGPDTEDHFAVPHEPVVAPVREREVA